jgi:hypothetical protein
MVDPSRARLAADVGLKKPDDIDPYLRGLAALGAIVVHVRAGRRTAYELPVRPPKGYAGPENTFRADQWQKSDAAGYARWRAQQRAKVDAAEAPYAEKRRARVVKSVEKKRAPQPPDLPVATGRSEQGDLPVATGTYLPVATGTYRPVATGTNHNDQDDQTIAVVAGRRPPSVVGGEGAGGCAAPSKIEAAEKVPPGDLRAVLEAIPGPLVALLEADWPNGLPATVNQRVIEALAAPRTVGEVRQRLARRWQRYEDDALAMSGPGITEPVAVLYALLAPSWCEGNNVRCEDGTDLDSGHECRICAEKHAEFHGRSHPEERATADAGPAVPPPREAPRGADVRPRGTCQDCRAAIFLFGAAVVDSLCPLCRAERIGPVAGPPPMVPSLAAQLARAAVRAKVTRSEVASA